jgi:hypothetical protein
VSVAGVEAGGRIIASIRLDLSVGLWLLPVRRLKKAKRI